MGEEGHTARKQANEHGTEREKDYEGKGGDNSVGI